MNTRERFIVLQGRARDAEEKACTYAIDLRVKYGDAYYRGNCGQAEEKRLGQLQKAAARESDKFFAFLDTVATRQFRSGVPHHWIVEHLTYDDATAVGPMAVVPPPAYGCTTFDSQRFAQAVRREEVAC